MKLQVRKIKGVEKYLGLMFRSKKTLPLLFEFKEDVFIPIHSWFVFFSFQALWLDENNKVLEKKIMMPFESYNPKQKARQLLEIPLR